MTRNVRAPARASALVPPPETSINWIQYIRVSSRSEVTAILDAIRKSLKVRVSVSSRVGGE